MTGFKKIADFDVARFMGEQSKVGNCIDGFFRDLFVGHNKAFPDEVICGAFDWDGETIWTPCGYEQAFNVWSRIGQFVAHVKSDAGEKSGTCYAYSCQSVVHGNEIIFGDDRAVWSAAGYKNADVQVIYKAKGSRTFDAAHLYVTRDGVVVFTDGRTLNILKRSAEENAGFVTHEVPLDDGISWFQLLDHERDSDLSYIAACVAKKTTTALDEPSRIMLISLKNKGVLNRVEVNGVQSFSRHPIKEEMVILGQKLTVLSLPNLRTLNSVELPLTGGARNADPERVVVKHNPSGQYLALAYAADGTVEIRATKTLEVMHTFNSQGARLLDLSWDRAGEYLACRFGDLDDQKKTELVVWNIHSQKMVFRVSTGNKTIDSFPGIAYRWSPRATELACLIDNKRIQVFALA